MLFIFYVLSHVGLTIKPVFHPQSSVFLAPVPLQNHTTQIKMAACGGFGSIDFLVKASGLSDPALRLTIGLFSGNLYLILSSLDDFEKINLSVNKVFSCDHGVTKCKLSSE